MARNPEALTFWQHLDELRTAIIKCVVASVVFALIAFFFKEEVFDVILAPRDSGFVTYSLLYSLNGLISPDDMQTFSVKLINTGLAEQFIIHVKTAFCVGILLASPYILYQIFRFVSPALYADEKRYAIRVAGGGYLMFLIGVAVSYFLVFPLTFRFLGTYQVDSQVENMISLQSYISCMMTMSLAMGVVFEIPVLSWLFAKCGFLTAEFMRRYRKHAVVVILLLAAIITPTSDIFTLSLVALPMWLLYEASIFIVARTADARKISRGNPSGSSPDFAAHNG